MIRKSLFWGLTLILVIALVNLIIRGRRLEKQQASRLAEVIQESKATSTRVLAPRDLEIVRSKMQLEEEVGGRIRSQTAWHEIEICNDGKIPYSGIQLSFDYLDSRGKLLATRTYSIVQTILPGATLKLVDITVDGLPVSTANSHVVIAYADIGNGQESKG
jgi:hypothetical protein